MKKRVLYKFDTPSLKWDRRGLIDAEHVSRKSKDPVKFEGAVLWDHEHVPIMQAYNGMSHNLLDLPARVSKAEIRALLGHTAIDNCLWLAARHAGHRLAGSTLYCFPTAPTVKDAALIIRARCARVVYQVHSRLEEAPNLTAKAILEECGIECVEMGIVK